MSAEAKRPGFLQNVLWSWFGISASLVSAFLLSPFVVRTLGDDDYGLWAVTVALVEYYWLLDFGLRSATIRQVAHHHALNESRQINTVLSVGVVYNVCLLPVLIGGTYLLRGPIAEWFELKNARFPEMLLIVVTSWSLTSLFGTFTSCLEGLQRFDIINQTAFIGTAVRAVGTFLLLRAGYGVVAMAWMTAGAQVGMHILNWLRLRGVFRELTISTGLADWVTFREMLSYGKHSVVSSLGQRILSQSPPLMIAAFLPERFAGYYTNPRQLLDYTAEAVMRVGNVSSSRAASLAANGQFDVLESFAISVNRLSLSVFLPLSIFLTVYGREFLTVWIRRPEFAENAAGVLFALLAGQTLSNAGQFSSSSVLFGIGKHQHYSRTLLAEAVLSVAGMGLLIPRYGIVAAAAWNSSLMVLNRSLITPWLLTRELKSSYIRFVTGVYRPLLAVPPVAVVLLLLKQVVPGKSWFELILMGGATMAVYTPIAYVLLPQEDRANIHRRLGGMLRSRASSAPIR